MDVFGFRNRVVNDYGEYVRSFITVRDGRINRKVREEMEGGFLWPAPLVQLNPSFQDGDPLKDLVTEGVLHEECLKIFREKGDDGTSGSPFQLYRHQVDGIRAAASGENYVLTTGTGSGKSLAYIVPIVDHVLRRGSGRGIQAIVVYPMNALANSQIGELEKFLHRGYPKGRPPVTFARYTGQESTERRDEIIRDPPDILLTNYVMLELVLTRFGRNEEQLVLASQGLRFLVLDELHTYRGRQGADVAMLVRRARRACNADRLIHIGTSATLSSEGAWPEQQKEVARVASGLFGAEVKPGGVIGETLRRATEEADLAAPSFQAALTDRVRSGTPPASLDDFLADPLSSWIESTLGIRSEDESDRLVRQKPMALTDDEGAAARLAEATGLSPVRCETALREALLAGYGHRDRRNRPLFAFRLHQFVSKGDSVYASPEPEDVRHITLQAQRYVPGSDRRRALLPLAFCRECGQEYYVVRQGRTPEGAISYLPREVRDRSETDEGRPGYLYISQADPWPDEPEEYLDRLPESWLQSTNGTRKVNRSQRKNLPQKVWISGTAEEDGAGQVAWWLPVPFRFCLTCSVAYDARQTSDFGKLSTLGSEGRSSATTVMTLTSVRGLRGDASLDARAKKLLSFTDNRQDASLQAGHFNDFVEVTLLRSALRRAAEAAGAEGLRHDTITLRVFEALDLPLRLYAADPDVKFAAREETDRALREVLGYYLYRDLRRGWRVTSPNLEQCGLLDIDYLSLGDFCRDESEWQGKHSALVSATPEDREKVCGVLLDFMRRELAIRVNFLDPAAQESVQQQSYQRLVPPWSIDDQERMERNRVVFPRAKGSSRGGPFVFLSPRGGFGFYLRRPGTLTPSTSDFPFDEVGQVIVELMELLTVPGILHRAMEPRESGDVSGYQLNASALIWRAGDGSKAFHDHIRVPRAPAEGLRTNPFFKGFYRSEIGDLKMLEAREHTAQVPGDERERREQRFREASLPVMYCSPTMELGVDIASLNVVNMRNVPPTPANYAQRSGRAGRSGQPAFVFSYCSAGSSHDQYFFKRPDLMVAGAVTAPRLDLQNEDLVRSHVHAVWLTASRLRLGSSMQDVLDVEGDDPSLEIRPEIAARLSDEGTRVRASSAAQASLGQAIRDLVGDGDATEWLDRVLRQVPKSFEEACSRWRDLYRAALAQSNRQQRIVLDPSRSPEDRRAAKRLRAEAEAQIALLLDSESSRHSDFYTYRYFASEGFLPGYNFPRLPLSAFLPSRRRGQGWDDFLSRPRFLAISEFGPRSIVYHEGARYVISKAILPVEGDEMRLKRRAVRCTACGYLHRLGDEPAPDLCESCDAPLPQPIENLFRMQNVATQRRERINSDEEERVRLGFEINTAVRFAKRAGAVSSRRADVLAADGERLATLTYGDAATLWRINLGWRRRKNKAETGFVLDVERGLWARSEAESADSDEPMSPRRERVIPYVDDRKNCLLLRPARRLDQVTMASVEAALKVAIQVEFQLEDRELATEALPDSEDRRQILFYEASEGGAGVLRELVEEPERLGSVCRRALEIAHFDPDTGEDRRRAPGAREDCEAACYDCLLSYYNQRHHRYIDRHAARRPLMEWRDAIVSVSPTPRPREAEVQRLLNACQTKLEKTWVGTVDAMGLKLPSDAQVLIEFCSTRPDFLYREDAVAIYVDGPHHDTPDQQLADRRIQEDLENAGYSVVRFNHADNWAPIFKQYEGVFGTPTSPPPSEPGDDPDVESESNGSGFDPEDFDEAWRPLMSQLAAAEGLTVDPGRDVMKGGRVVDMDLATIGRADRTLRLVDTDRSSAVPVAEALRSSGESVLTLHAAADGNFEAILAALGE